jgi:hypothetical protein
MVTTTAVTPTSVLGATTVAPQVTTTAAPTSVEANQLAATGPAVPLLMLTGAGMMAIALGSTVLERRKSLA